MTIGLRKIDLAGYTEAYFEKMLLSLPALWKFEILKYTQWVDRLRSLEARLLLHGQLLKMGYPVEAFQQIELTGHKKPFFPELPDFRFSLSHSNDMAACASSIGCQIGIDIEHVKPINFENIRSVLNESEWNEVKGAPDQLYRFYEIWTAKEAVIKADGRGMYAPLKRLKLNKTSAELDGVMWQLKKLELERGYCGWVAYDGSPLSTIHINYC